MITKLTFLLGIFAASFLISSASQLSPPDKFLWPLNSKNLCFAARFNLSISVQYLKKDGTNTSVTIPLDEKSYETFTVSCDEINSHELKLYMLSSLTGLFFRFNNDANNNTASLTHIYGYVTINDLGNFFPDFADSVQGTHRFSANESAFVTNRDKSFQCNSKTAITDFQMVGNVTLVSINFENLRIQPFVNETEAFDDFADADICSADDDKDSNIVPIIVGACLSVLVVIVLVAYVIGRRRSRNGYQSV